VDASKRTASGKFKKLRAFKLFASVYGLASLSLILLSAGYQKEEGEMKNSPEGRSKAATP